MITLPIIIIIIIISLFTTEIATNSYCYQQLQTVANNIKQNFATNNTASKTCCDVNTFYFLTKPYEMRYWCGGRWVTSNVLCDTTTAGGGWTVIQRRLDGSENFNRPWSDYEKGFGNLTGEFWYGLKAINCLTQAGQWELRIDFEFKNGTRSYLHYNLFKVGNTNEQYPLTISGFTGITHTNPFLLHQHNGMKFSTYDNDNDLWPDNCAEKVDSAEGNGGWWYNTCWTINLNIKYNPAQHGFMYLTGTWYNPRWIEMKIRPLNCIPP